LNPEVKLSLEDMKHSRFIPQKLKLLFGELEETGYIKTREYAGEVVSFVRLVLVSSITFFP
jgi:hypothetical protein